MVRTVAYVDQGTPGLLAPTFSRKVSAHAAKLGLDTKLTRTAQGIMEKDSYLVVPPGEHWAVKLNGGTLGTFESRSEAIRAAITVAHSSGQHGVPSEVLSHAPGGETHPIWVYGRDTYSSG